MYIRHQGDALDALAQILALPDRRQQIVQSTIKIMLCLDAEPRMFLVDCQALLLDGGLDALRRKRQESLVALDSVPILILDPEGDRMFEAAASGLDALRLTDVVRRVFPLLRQERWIIARALLTDECAIQAQLSAAIKSHGQQDVVRCALASVDSILASRHPAWGDRAGTIRAACVDVLKGARLTDPDCLHEEADLLFELFALSDERAQGLLDALDRSPEDAVHLISRLYEALDMARAIAVATPAPAAKREAA